MSTPITVAALNSIIRRIEGHLAPGSETPLWGDFLERMRRLTGGDDSLLDRGEAAWWLGAYCALKAWEAGGSVLDDDGRPMMGLRPTDQPGMSDVSTVEAELGPMSREEVGDMEAGYEWYARQLIDSV